MEEIKWFADECALLFCIVLQMRPMLVLLLLVLFDLNPFSWMRWDEMQTLKSWKFAEMDFIASLKPKPPIKELDQLISATIKCYTFTQLHTFMYLDVVRGLCKNHSNNNNKQASKQISHMQTKSVRSISNFNWMK